MKYTLSKTNPSSREVTPKKEEKIDRAIEIFGLVLNTVLIFIFLKVIQLLSQA